MQYLNRPAPLTRDERAKREEERQIREAELRLKNNRLGLAIFQGSWLLVFVCLIIIYWQIGFQPGWRPTPEQAPGALLPTLVTIGLLGSGWFVRRALKIVQQTAAESDPVFLRDWQIALGLGFLFLVVMATQFVAVPAGGDGQQFGIIYRLLIGYHAVHALVVGYLMLRILRRGGDGRYHRANAWPVEATTKLWYFVIVAWLLFYAVLYLPFLL